MIGTAIGSDETTRPNGTPGAPDLVRGVTEHLDALLGLRGRRAAVAALGVLVLCLIVVSGLPTRLRAWVHDRPEYRLDADEIRLDPPPPLWLRHAHDRLIEPLSSILGAGGPASALDLDLGAIASVLKKVPWVEEVRSIRRRYPAGINVAIAYRRPVALWTLEEPDPHGVPRTITFFIDARGVILDRIPPGDDVDPKALPELIELSNLKAPAIEEPGTSWSRPGAGDGTPVPDEAAMASAALAEFLLDRAAEEGWPVTPDGRTRCRPVSITPGNGKDERNLFVSLEGINNLEVWILWSEDPGRSPGFGPDDRKRWRIFREWVGGGGPSKAPAGAYLRFTIAGLVWEGTPKGTETPTDTDQGRSALGVSP